MRIGIDTNARHDGAQCQCREELERLVLAAEEKLSRTLPTPVRRLTLDDSLGPQGLEALVAQLPGDLDALWLFTIRRRGAECRLHVNHMLVDAVRGVAEDHHELRPLVDAPYCVLQHFAPKLETMVNERLMREGAGR